MMKYTIVQQLDIQNKFLYFYVKICFLSNINVYLSNFEIMEVW